MDFEYTEEQQMVRQTIREFALKELAPTAAERDEKEIYPADAVKKLADLGFMGMTISPEYGGAGLDNIAYVIAVEELSRVDASAGIIMSVHNSLVGYPVDAYSNAEQKERFLKPIAVGKMLGAFALTEPGSGSDAGAMNTTAVKDGKDYVLNGSKNFITTGSNCDVLLVFVVTDPAAGSKGTSAFLVERETPGFNVGKHEKKLGIRSSDTVSISFEDCRVPVENMLGEPGMGFKIALSTLNAGRIGVAAQALGIAQGCLDESIKYSQERKQFGRSISSFQAIRFKIARMAMEVQASRLMVYYAAAKKERGDKYIKEAAMAKVFNSEIAVRAGLEAIQIHGGYGYIKEYPVERYLRDAKITTIYEGTNEILHLVITEQLLGR